MLELLPNASEREGNGMRLELCERALAMERINEDRTNMRVHGIIDAAETYLDDNLIPNRYWH